MVFLMRFQTVTPMPSEDAKESLIEHRIFRLRETRHTLRRAHLICCFQDVHMRKPSEMRCIVERAARERGVLGEKKKDR